MQQSGGGDRAGVRRQERVGHRQAGEQRQAVEQDRLAGALGGGVDERREDEDADVEEDGDAEDEAGQAHRERGALLAEEVEQAGGQDLGTAADFEDGAEHGAEADDDRDVAEDAAHAGLDDRDRVGLLDRAEQFRDGESGGEADGYGHGEQGDERLESDLDDEEEQERDTEGGDREQSGRAVEEGQEAAGVRWRLGGLPRRADTTTWVEGLVFVSPSCFRAGVSRCGASGFGGAAP